MKEIEKKLQEEVFSALKSAEIKLGVKFTRFFNLIEKDGITLAVKKAIKNGSDNFDTLADNKMLTNSLEAIVTKACYSSLFEDSEVDIALERLVEAGYYNI